MVDPLYLYDYKSIINQEYDRRRTHNKSYSLRSFARDLEISPSGLSDILSGRRGLSHKKAQDMASKLKLSQQESEHFLDLVLAAHARVKSKKVDAQTRIDHRKKLQNPQEVELFTAMAEWYHLAILEALDLEQCRGTPQSLAKLLGLSRQQVNKALDRLIKLGLVSKKNNRYQARAEETFVSSRTPVKAIRNYHSALLDKAQDSIQEGVIAERVVSSTVFSLDEDCLEEARQFLKEMRVEFAKRFGSGQKKNNVYCLGLQFFSLLREP